MARDEDFVDWLVYLKPRAHATLRRSLRHPVGEHTSPPSSSWSPS